MDNKANIPFPRRSGWKVVVVVGLTLMMGVWVLCSGVSLDHPVRLKRGHDGELHAVGEDITSNQVLAQAGIVAASSSKSTVTSSNHTGPGWFPAKRLIVWNRSEHLLMQRVGEAILKQLKKRSNWEDVLYLPADHQLESATADIYLMLEMTSLKTAGALGRELQVTLNASIGTSPVSSDHMVQDASSPPLLHFNSEVELDHRSTLTGLESGKYVMQGEKIAEEIIGTLDNLVQGFRDKHPPPPATLDKLIAEYHPTPTFDFLQHGQLLLSTSGVMTHNDTLWSLPEVADKVHFLTTVSETLQQQGWSEYYLELEQDGYLRLKKEASWLEVFPKKAFRQDAADAPATWYVRYRERMRDEDLQSFFAELLQEESPHIDLLISLEQFGNKEQREQLVELAEQHPPATASSWLRIANWFGHRKEQAKLIHALKRANVASLFVEDRNDISRDIRKLIKKHDLDQQQVLAIDIELLEAAGVSSITPERPEVTLEVDLLTAAAVYVPSPDSTKWEYAGTMVSEVRSTPADTENGEHNTGAKGSSSRYKLSFYNGDETRSRGSSSICCLPLDHPHTHGVGSDGNRLEFTISKLSPQRFQVICRLQQKQPET